MMGMIKLSIKEHCVIESKPDHLPHDLRMSCPWPELVEYVTSFNVEDTSMDDITFRHLPYVVILLQCLEKVSLPKYQ